MTQLLVIGFSKPIRGKGLSKNKPTCENAVGVVWKLDAPGYGLLVRFLVRFYGRFFCAKYWGQMRCIMGDVQRGQLYKA